MATKRKSIVQSNPTTQAYGSLQAAFDHFNRELFGGSLPHCLITMQRHAHSYGYFSGDRFTRAHTREKQKGQAADEIALNPQYIAERSPEKVLSTLAHEMAHSWQHHHGKPPTRCYHDRQWAGKMHEIGLHPSSTGMEGGKETGPKVSHYITAGGPFAKACAAFLKKNKTAFYQDQNIIIERAKVKAKAKAKKAGGDDESEEDEAPKSPGRIKFQCFGCKLNAWAKPSAKLRCDDCDRPLKPAEAKEEDDGE